MIHFIATHWPYALPVIAGIGAPLAYIAIEKRLWPQPKETGGER